MKFRFLFPLLLSACAACAWADDNSTLIAHARSAAPAMISEDATIMIDAEVVVEGTNGWVCMPDTMPEDNFPHCSDKVWMEMFDAVANKAPYNPTQMGISYMLQGDGGVSNSDPYHPNPPAADDFIKEGPHLMVIVPREMLEGITDDPDSGEPYVMWKDTPYAHIMIPVGGR